MLCWHVNMHEHAAINTISAYVSFPLDNFRPPGEKLSTPLRRHFHMLGLYISEGATLLWWLCQCRCNLSEDVTTIPVSSSITYTVPSWHILARIRVIIIIHSGEPPPPPPPPSYIVLRRGGITEIAWEDSKFLRSRLFSTLYLRGGSP